MSDAEKKQKSETESKEISLAQRKEEKRTQPLLTTTRCAVPHRIKPHCV